MAIVSRIARVVYDEEGNRFVEADLFSETAPASLDITGADVEGLADRDVLAVGTRLVTPDTEYRVFENGGSLVEMQA